MFDVIQNNDIVITDNKEQLLKYLNDNKKLLNIKIMNKNEFINEYFGYLDNEALYYLVKKYNYKYDIALMYMSNFLFIDSLYNELALNKLIRKNELFRQNIKRIILIDQHLDKYIMDEISKYEIIEIKENNKNYSPVVYKFDSIDEEIDYVAVEILKLLNKVDINDIFLVNVTEEYILPIRRIFSFYKIPINLNCYGMLYSYPDTKKFLSMLDKTKDINLSIETIKNIDIKNEIISICNNYTFTSIDDTIVYLIKEEIKNKKIKNKKLSNAINVTGIRNMTDSDKYYFILGFNEGILPKVYKDEDYISDLKKSKLGILTSIEKNEIEKEIVINKIRSYKNVVLSYKLRADTLELYKSSLISDLSLEESEIVNNNYNYSQLYNKIKLSIMLDDLIKYNKNNKDLSLLYSNYFDLPYLKYDNKYKKIPKERFYKYINNNLLLSYSSIDNYYKCAFKYYLTNILKLDKYEETFMTYIGSLFHYILSIAFNENFDFDYEFNNYIKDKEFTPKEYFFISKLKSELLFTIETIKKQDLNTCLNNSLYETKVFVNKDRNIKINFMGIIDKLKYYEVNNETLVSIVDYKTGIKTIDLNNIIYGLDMQLPIYLYLSKRMEIPSVKVIGFFLQKIIHDKLAYEEGKNYIDNKEKLYRLKGYSINDINYLEKLDKNYFDSKMIKGLKTSSKGFYAYSKVLSDKEISEIDKIVDKKIDEAIDNIMECNFEINPKKIKNDLVGCEFCKFKDICYMKEEDIKVLDEVNYKEFLGGE